MKKVIFLLQFMVVQCFQAQTFNGLIKDELLNSPLRYVSISLYDDRSVKIDSTVSDINGEWVIDIPSTGINKDNLPESFIVHQNYPNPFNPSTTIRFEIKNAGATTISIHDILGQLVSSKSAELRPGLYSINWGGGGSAGVYLYTITSNNRSVTKKMVQLDGRLSGGFSEIRTSTYGTTTKTAKISNGTYKLVFSKFAYSTDTVEFDPGFTRYFETLLETIHSKAIVVDLHNDVLEKMLVDGTYHLGASHTYNHTDLPRLKKGGVDVQLFVSWVDPGTYEGRYFETTNKMINILKSEINQNSSEFGQGYDYTSTLSLVDENKIAAILVVEGGHSIENKLENLITLYNSGMRYLTITWNNSTDWAVSAQDSRSLTVGLSDFGKKVIHSLDSLGVIVDVSHTGIKTIEDILEVSENPIIASHSGVRALQNHYRNLYDDQIKAIANSGGVIGVVFYPPFLGSPSSSVDISKVLEHIDYIVNLVGVDHVSLGSDFDGIGTNTVNGLEDVSKFPFLTNKLLESGYNESEVTKILGGNFLRVLKKVCRN